jgi:hypothetical protein
MPTFGTLFISGQQSIADKDTKLCFAQLLRTYMLKVNYDMFDVDSVASNFVLMEPSESRLEIPK